MDANILFIATATKEPVTVGYTHEERIKKINECLTQAKAALDAGDREVLKAVLLKAFTLSNQL